MLTKEQVLEQLKTVPDPQTGQDIVQRGIVAAVGIEGDEVQVSLQLNKAQLPHKDALNFAVIEAIQLADPKTNVHVHVKSLSSENATPSQLPNVRNVIAVASGKGGVGKSTISVNLALALRKENYRVGLMDADVYGPSVPTMLGLQGKRPKVEELYGKHKMQPLEAYGISVISIGNIIDPEQAVVLRGPRLAGVIKQFVTETLWPDLDYLVIDLPPGTGDVQLTVVQTLPVTGVVMVTTPQEVAVIDAIKAMNMFLLPQVNVPILGIVENMSWFTPAELPEAKYPIFGSGGGEQLATKSGTPMLAQLPIVMDIRAGADQGKPAALSDDPLLSEPFQTLAQNVIQAVDKRNAAKDPTKVVEVK